MSDQNPHANWWCWTENEPSTFHCRERGHEVRVLPRGGSRPTVEDRAARQSTSAQLRQTQAALAASQADLSRVERERDDVGHDLAHATFQLSMERTRLHHARAELASARQELETYRDGRLWQVAQRPVAPCSSCSQPITRGQAFQPLAAAEGHYAHSFCPDQETSPDA